jgi:hypothetical protein
MRPRQSPPTIEPLGTGDLMPALLVGFGPLVPAPDSTAWRNVAGAAGLPSWLVHVDQQAGGMSMFYPSALGCLLRFSANSEHALQDPKRLIAGFHCMAEDPQVHVLRREHPDLYPLCRTWGEAYGSAQLLHLRAAVEPYFRLPYPKSGHEAFVEYEDNNPLDYLRGWRIVEINDDVDVVEGEQRTYGALWRDGRRLDDAVLRDLGDIAKLVVPGRALQLFLLWENCD